VLTRCISDRLRSNRQTVGCELSAGMDSTSITAIAHAQLQGTGAKLLTSTVRFPTIASAHESRYAEAVQHHVGFESLFFNGEDIGALDYPSAHPCSPEYPWIFRDPSIGAPICAAWCARRRGCANRQWWRRAHLRQ